MKTTLTAIILSLAAGPALASFDPCETGPEEWQSVVAPALAGRWSVESGAGAAVAGGMTLPMPPEPPEPAEIRHVDGRLELTFLQTEPGEPAGPYTISFEDSVDWELTPSPDAPITPRMRREILDDEALSVLTLCDANSLPRLHVSRSFVMEGATLTMDIYLYVVSPDILYGGGVWRGPGATGRRIIRMTR